MKMTKDNMKPIYLIISAMMVLIVSAGCIDDLGGTAQQEQHDRIMEQERIVNDLAAASNQAYDRYSTAYDSYRDAYASWKDNWGLVGENKVELAEDRMDKAYAEYEIAHRAYEDQLLIYNTMVREYEATYLKK